MAPGGHEGRFKRALTFCGVPASCGGMEQEEGIRGQEFVLDSTPPLP